MWLHAYMCSYGMFLCKHLVRRRSLWPAACWHAAQVREREAEIDSIIGPIEEMYALLTRYEVRCAASSSRRLDRTPPLHSLHVAPTWCGIEVAEAWMVDSRRPLLRCTVMTLACGEGACAVHGLRVDVVEHDGCACVHVCTQVKLPKEEVDAVGDLRYAWRALRKRALDAAAELGRLQARRGLLCGWSVQHRPAVPRAC